MDNNRGAERKDRECAGDETDSNGLKSLLAVSALHFLNDLHPTLLPTFLPEIVKRLSLSLGEAGFLSTVFGMLNLIVQPLAGHLSDRCDRPLFATWAPLLTAAGAYFLPIASSYSMALFFVGILGLGTSSFHPQGHGLAGAVGGPARLGSYLAVFAAAGTLGAALSPLYAVFLLSVLGASRIPIALFFVLVFLLAVRIWIPKSTHGRRERESNKGFPPRLLGSMWVVVKLCFGLIVISIVRDSTFQGIRVFLPLLVTGRGGSLEMGGTVLFTFTLAGTISNLIGGKLGDVFGKTRIIVIMLCLSPLFLFPAIRTSGALSIALFVLGGACITATNPITLALAQEYVPQFRSTASSFVMGVAWGIANIVASPIGMLADRIGLEPTLGFLALMPLFVVIGIGMARLFGRRRAT